MKNWGFAINVFEKGNFGKYPKKIKSKVLLDKNCC